MKKFLLKLMVLACLVSTIPLCNYIVDPSHVYEKGNYEKSIVDILISKKNVTNTDANLNERLLKRFLVQRYSKNVDNLILGPSRTMLLSEKVLKDGSVLNLSVSGGALEDMISMYYITKLSGIKTKNVIICLDPQMFNDNNTDSRWRDNEAYYHAFFHKDSEVTESKVKTDWMRINNLFSMSYFQSSLKLLPSKIKNAVNGKRTVLVATMSYDNAGETMHYDGSRSFNVSTRNPDQIYVNMLASKWTYRQFDSYDHLSEKYKKELQDLIDCIKKDGVHIRVLCAPYHPLVYQKLITKKHFEYAKLGMEYIHSFSALNHIEIIGSYNPANCGCDESCFYDGVHLNGKGIGILFEHPQRYRCNP